MSGNVIMFSGENQAEETETTLGTALTRVSKHHVDGEIHSGFWECHPGVFTIEAHGANEMCHILEGEATITHADGSVLPIAAGDSFFIPKGTKMTWTVEKYIRKAYMVSP